MLIWMLLVMGASIQSSLSVSPRSEAWQKCQGSGEPCLEFVHFPSYCDASDLQQAAAIREHIPTPALEEEDMDLYPWWIAEGSNKRLCCDVKLSQPLLIETLKMEWYFYPKLDDFGSDSFIPIQSDSNYIVTEGITSGKYRGMLRVNITNASAKSEGAYACRVTAKTKPPGVAGTAALTIGQLSEPIVVRVYSENLEFEKSDAEHNNNPNARIEDYASRPYVDIEYAVKSVNPRKKLIVAVETDDTLLQYVDMRAEYKMYISTFGDTEYLDRQFNKPFTVSLYYEGEENKKISRTWNILGGYQKSENTVFRPEFDELKGHFDKMFSFFVVGSCEKFEYEVQLNSGNSHQLNFDRTFPEDSQQINDGKFTLNYRFNNEYCSGDLKRSNSYVELNLTRSDYNIAKNGDYDGSTDLQVTVTCAAERRNYIGPEAIYYRGLPWFPSIEANEKNCLTYNQSSPDEYVGIKTVGNYKRRFMCCKTEGNLYPNSHLWLNGQYLNPETSDMFVSKTLNEKDVLLENLYDAENETARYLWFEKFAGYFQCFVGRYSYQIGTGKRQPRYPTVKSRRYKIGFERFDFKKLLRIDLEETQSFRPKKSDEKRERNVRAPRKGQNVTSYQIEISDREMTLVKGSCVGLTAIAVVFPHEKLIWEVQDGKAVSLYSNLECTEPYVEETINERSVTYQDTNPSFTYAYQPYDKVTIKSRAYVGIVNAEKTDVTVKLAVRDSSKSKFHTISLNGEEPFLEDPVLEFSAPGTADSITCTITGYPIDRANLTAIMKKSKTKVLLESYDITRNKSLTGDKLTLSAKINDKMHSVECSVLNNLIKQPEKKMRIDHEIVKLPSTAQADVTLIVVVVIGIALLILVIWIVCACVAMARNPQTKFGEAMCCRTGPYKKVEKIPMDPYKLEYFTLNPSVTLGGGHFGIVRRGFCTVLHDRAGERTEIAIKEVKPCIDRLRREDDLRRERDIMMRLRGHSNVLRIYGYTDEPDTLALVMEFAAFGSLDKLLVEARKIKSDGYLMPNEQIENPIKAFESQHIVDFGRQISDGMDYICRNQIVHRDLAARNIVVAGEDAEYVLKITDFGLAREICDDGFYERVEGKEIPIKWTAPESLRGNIYTSKSDVWSFGITLWEICTLGGEPYAGYNNVETMEKLRSGYRLQKPPSCNTDLYDLMKQCWLESPAERPEFSEILTLLTTYSQKPSDYVHIDSLYETDLNLTVRLQTLQPPSSSNNHHPSSSSTPPSSPEAV